MLVIGMKAKNGKRLLLPAGDSLSVILHEVLVHQLGTIVTNMGRL
jgi:hypothetical protein